MALLFLIALVNIELADWTSFPGKSCLTGMTPKTWSDWENTGVAARLEECRQQCISSMLCGAAEIRSVSGFFCEQGKEQCVQPRDMILVCGVNVCVFVYGSLVGMLDGPKSVVQCLCCRYMQNLIIDLFLCLCLYRYWRDIDANAK